MSLTVFAALSAATLLGGAGPAQAETAVNVWVRGSAPSYDTYIVSVGAQGRTGLVNLDMYVSYGQVITGVRNGTAFCQYGHFGATCDLVDGKFPQHFEVTVKRYDSANGPFHLQAIATTSTPEQDYADNSTVIETY
ncbi:hypothetical protein E1286_29745 [Nonomuraea terrae]|uniref:Uncharacterized protein n=1 Tax=Nonomuraea terrae TaxID=2530383 RepID=A0A4R4YI25_9ACTN|nr:hypothetical protein [Nonomuraea terrae]TDD42972.1 hypothetical protein E1286_29745 [Nonomuraea terrae]